MSLKSLIYTCLFSSLAFTTLSAQGHDTPATHTPATTEQHGVQPAHGEAAPHGETAHGAGAATHSACHPDEKPSDKYDPVPNVMHHIGDATSSISSATSICLCLFSLMTLKMV